jgi:hypothetical protein
MIQPYQQLLFTERLQQQNDGLINRFQPSITTVKHLSLTGDHRLESAGSSDPEALR